MRGLLETPAEKPIVESLRLTNLDRIRLQRLLHVATSDPHHATEKFGMAFPLSAITVTLHLMTCPLCHQSTTWEGNPWRPFCSERCQLTDLGTWAMEQYRIPGPSLTTGRTILGSSDSQDGTDNT